MNSFRNHRLRDFAVPMSTNGLFNDIAEAKGRQTLYTRQSPQLLKALREMRECPGVSLDMIRHLLDQQRKTKKVKCLGTGRSAHWRKIGN
jgi:DNA-binding transcriptional MerR regulator